MERVSHARRLEGSADYDFITISYGNLGPSRSSEVLGGPRKSRDVLGSPGMEVGISSRAITAILATKAIGACYNPYGHYS